MVHGAYFPGPPLNEFVECFWQIGDGQGCRIEPVFPSGTIEIVVNLHDDEVRTYEQFPNPLVRSFSGVVLSGTYSARFACDPMQHESMFGVHFKPGGAFPFLETGATELKDTHADLIDFWGRRAREFRERLCTAATPQGRFRVAEEVLCGRLPNIRKPNPAVRLALQMFGPAGKGATVRDAAREVGLCQRRFIEVFRTQVGLNPKLFCRILRFQSARWLAAQIGGLPVCNEDRDGAMLPDDWAEIATVCGYFDQSHLINDFEQFSGLSPTAYIRQNNQQGLVQDNHRPAVPGQVNFFQYAEREAAGTWG